MPSSQPIGVFDSGYGGLTVLKSIVEKLPDYDFIYLGDNARAPYGNRSFETVYQYTREAVQWFFSKGCPLVILACNTSSAKALRTIQQQDLAESGTNNRVLGVIRPTTEIAGILTKTEHIGILATSGTVNSESYVLEINKFFPNVKEDDWTVEVAGQRVQIIKKDPTHGGILQFGTELVSAADRSIVAMLGASPGASTSVWIMLEVIQRCFPEKLKEGAWLVKLKEMIPSYGQSLIENAALCRQVRAETAAILNINNIEDTKQ